jgi:hypothetical protein
MSPNCPNANQNEFMIDKAIMVIIIILYERQQIEAFCAVVLCGGSLIQLDNTQLIM